MSLAENGRTPVLGDLESRLEREGAAFLDVGTGVGWLAVAMARAFPNLRVVGIDVFDPSLQLAAGNIAPVRERVELRMQDVVRLDDDDVFDAAFLPGPFLPRHVVPDALTRVHASLRAGGWLLFGVYAPVDDPLSATLTDLRVVRSGGHSWSAKDVVDMLDRAGFRETRAFDRAWQMPMTFVVGRR